MANTPVYGWETPDDTDYVYQGAAAARTTANAIDSTLSTQVATLNATIANGPRGIIVYQRSTTELVTPGTTEVSFMGTGSTFTPVAGRLYEITITVGDVKKKTTVGGVYFYFRKNGLGGTLLNVDSIEFSAYDTIDYSTGGTYSWTKVYTSATLGTTAFTPSVSVATNLGTARCANTTNASGGIFIKDIGPA